MKSVFLHILRDGKRYLIDLLPFLRTESDNEQGRDNLGRFTSGGGKSGKKSEKGDTVKSGASKRGRFKRSRKVLDLPKEEFARVQHAFMSDVTKEQREKYRLEKCIGDYRYTAVLREDGTRDIIGKVKINGID